MMCSAAAEHDVPYGYDARLRLMMCASRMSGTHRIIATKGSGIIFAERQKHHLPVRANIIAGICRVPKTSPPVAISRIKTCHQYGFKYLNNLNINYYHYTPIIPISSQINV